VERGIDEWPIEYLDADRAGYITLFAGPEARRRAHDYFEALRIRRLKIVRAGPPAH
jgi:hypothetical protein